MTGALRKSLFKTDIQNMSNDATLIKFKSCITDTQAHSDSKVRMHDDTKYEEVRNI